MIFSKVIGTGGYLPEEFLTNYDLEKRVETTHAWIVERTGIVKRHIANSKETTTMMGTEAARRALKMAGVQPNSIDMVVVATCTPDLVFPSAACLIQAELGLGFGPAFDVQAACSGFMYALHVADNFIRSGSAKRALVIGSEVMSRVVDWTDRKTCILFGDGAGALILEASSQPGIVSCTIGADGRHKDILYLENGNNAVTANVGAASNSSTSSVSSSSTGSNNYRLQMQGNAVFKLAVNMLDQIAAEVMTTNRFNLSDVNWLVPHQANIRIIQATAQKLNIPMERVVVTLHDQGNTSAASIPLAFDCAVRDGRIVGGQHILLEAFGGGLTWGTALIKV